MNREDASPICYYCIVDDDASRFKYVPPQWKSHKANLRNDFDLEILARDCADDYHYHHDGLKSDWPLIIALFATEDGPELARFSVDREAVPAFNATRIAGKEAAE
jgi:hypothetical protein